MNGKIKAVIIALFIFACTFVLIYLFAPEPEQEMTVYHYQVPPEDIIKDKFEKRIGKQNYTIELAWVARTSDGHIYIERIR